MWGLSQRKWFPCIIFFNVNILLQTIAQIKLHLIYLLFIIFFFLVKATCAFEQANSCSVYPNCSLSIACWEKNRGQQLVVM